jgi:glycine/D-amino acid oxidase-like deaminating enzyme
MQVDVLIIGQGLCGTFLCRELQKAGLSYIVIDDGNPLSASRVAAGLINPVTGRRIVKTWMIDTLLPFAIQAYAESGMDLGISCGSPSVIVDFFPNPQMRTAFLDRYEEDPGYLEWTDRQTDWIDIFQYDFGYGVVNSCYLTSPQRLLDAMRSRLRTQKRLLEEQWDASQLQIEDKGVRYKDIRATYLILCDGIGSVDGPWFNRLPFAPNKGEALMVQIAGLPTGMIFKKGIQLTPLHDDLYWAGASYEWSYNDDLPTKTFRHKTESTLNGWLKRPFKIIDHVASIRPATLERRPFVGFHPLYPAIGILGGMGSKGCSLAPYFARQLVDYLALGAPVLPEVDVRRFSRILSAGS